jgi:hypothetical protein
MPWNIADHRRKFFVAPGRYLDGDDQIGGAELDGDVGRWVVLERDEPGGVAGSEFLIMLATSH